MQSQIRKAVAMGLGLTLVAAACGTEADAEVAGAVEGQPTIVEGQPTVAVTTNILGDVVSNLVGDQANVVTLMSVGSDPHDFQASAQQISLVGESDAFVTNGANFEEGLLDLIDSIEDDGAVPVHEAIDGVLTIEFEEDDVHGHEEGEEHDDEEGEEHDDEEGEEHDDEEGEEHDDEEGEEHDDEEGEEHDDEEGEEHAHEGADPHFFTDPVRMAVAIEGITEFLAQNVEGVDVDVLRANADSYLSELTALDAELTAMFDDLSQDQRKIVTNHEVFGYFADRYDFEVIGTIVPSGSTTDGVSGQELAELAEVIENEGVPAVFAETSSSDELAQTLASEVGDIAVVELFSESLGDADSEGATYIDMVRSNATRIVSALG